MMNLMTHLIDYMVPKQTPAIVNEVFIEGFHALYNVQMGELKVVALFDTGASINATSSRFFRFLQHQLKVIPMNRKVYQQMVIVRTNR